MDPRHPEQAVIRLKELIAQYDRIENDIAHATVSSQLAQLEREGGLVVQEICLVAPRVHEAMMQASRNRRYDLAHGVVIDMSKYEIPAGALKELTPEAVENCIEPKPKKKKTAKKKKAE